MLQQAYIFTAFGTVGYSLSDTVSRTSLIKQLARRGAKCSKIIPGQPDALLTSQRGTVAGGQGISHQKCSTLVCSKRPRS
jgi:hypothetical protein